MKKSILFSLLAATTLAFTVGCSTGESNNNTVNDELILRYQNYLDNGGTLTYQEWLAFIEDPNINNEDYEAPYIASNGNWFVEGMDTGVKASGEDGESITITSTEIIVKDGLTYTEITFSDGTKIDIPHGVDGNDGEDGLTPYIKDGYWYIGELNTNIKATGDDGESVSITSSEEIEENGTKFVEVNFSDGTSIKIPLAKDGVDGYTPYIQDGYWYINGVSTGVSAKGDEVEMRVNEGNIEWKTSSSDIWNVLLSVDILKGNDGLNGESAYEIYKKYCGYAGSEEEWIYDLVNGLLNFEDPGIIDYIPPYRMRVAVGETINLPTRINAIYSNGLVEEVNVKWNKSNLTSSYVGEKKILGYVENYQEKVECYVYVSRYTTTEKYVDGYINGIQDDDKVSITLFNDSIVRTISPSLTGYYKFDSVPDGNYYLKIDANGYEAIDLNTADISSVTVDESSLYNNIEHVNFNLKTLRENGYYSCWQSTETGYTYETVSNINKEIKVDFVENSSEISDDGAASILREQYNVVLLNDEISWSTETSSRFLELYKTIPESVTSSLKSTWTLTDRHINNDIIINLVDDHYEVVISMDAIENATPRVATIDGQVGKYYSKRLYNAMIRFVTKEGYDDNACETILNTNFLCSFNVPDYSVLTNGITNETEASFQEFLPDEKILILTMFEEMPEGMHKISELKYLVRRKTGQSHPIYPDAAAVTWTKASEPYIEFMDKTFIDNQGYYDTKRLIIHEKTHMFYEYYFSDELKKTWYEIGGWYQDETDPDEWKTTKETEFVSAYAHAHNPDEDMAESVATYVINPDLLKSRSINKYNFIKNYIMNGSYYILETREDLKFEVYNLSPDYIYPGKIKSTIIKVTGDYYEDKNLDVRFKLFGDDNTNGANSYLLRIQPCDKNSNQYYDLRGRKTDEYGLNLQGNIKISKYSYQNYWFTDQITLYDSVGNERYVNGSDVGFKVYFDNPLSDTVVPTLVKHSLGLSVENSNNPDHPDEQKLIVKYEAHDASGIDRALVRLVSLEKNKESIDVYAQSINNETGEIITEIIIPNHFSSGTYEVTEISLWDKGTNNYFEHVSYGGLEGENNKIDIVTTNPDNEGPTMDENNISVSAVPSIPEAPNGETFVTLKLRVKDNISGFKTGYIRILDPQGINHGYWLNPPVYSGYYFTGDPTVEVEYTFKITLPEGSAPGIWSIYEISLNDFALNTTVYDFTEIIHFDVND